MGSIPGQGTRFRMPQLTILPQPGPARAAKTPRSTAATPWCSQINILKIWLFTHRLFSLYILYLWFYSVKNRAPKRRADKNIRVIILPVCFLCLSVQLLSRVWLCNPMNHSTPGLPVHHQLPEFTETHVHRVSDAIQPSHPLSSPSPPAPNPSQHQSPFQWVNSSHEVAR